MKHYQLILIGRHPKTHELSYQVACNGEIIVSECTYNEGYFKVAKLMETEDLFQEIEDNDKSKEMSYTEMLQGNFVLNFDKINQHND